MKSKRKSANGSLVSRTPVAGIVLLVVTVAGLLVDTTSAGNDNFYSDLIRLDNVVTKIHQSYVEKVGSKELVDKAVDGMLEVLDPHTSYFEEKAFEELRIHTEGKFGGLGIQISIRDNVLTVMTPIAGTPAARAGIQSGDQILEINGETTKGIKLDDAVSKLRGEPGTEVTILIGRLGEPRPVNYTITREVIRINAVPFAGVLDKNIGYVRLNSFSEEAGGELEKSIRELLKKEIKGLVLDLRGNPGGLLPQAIEVASKFLPRKSLVVYTRGRAPDQDKDFEVPLNPVLPAEVKLAVLVNRASASASEIVAGAIQDWDRGVILGDTTFGKGSVQTIIKLDPTHHLKLTTAYYYTPSGRCINRPENATRGAKGTGESEGEEEEGTEEIAPARADSTAAPKADTTVYRTRNKRIVHGGGGIVPDTVVPLPRLNMLMRSLFKNDLFFKFANTEHLKLQKRKVVIDSKYAVDDKVMKDFLAFLDTVKFESKTPAEVAFDDLQGLLGIKDTAVDSATRAQLAETWSKEEVEGLRGMCARIDSVFRKKQTQELRTREEEMRTYVREALLVRVLGSDNETVYRVQLGQDNQVNAAIRVLTDARRYESLLSQ